MSYSTLYVFFDDGVAVPYKRFKNGFGSAPRVWNALSEKYGRVLHPEPERLPFIMELWQEIWKVEDKVEIPWWEHNLLHWTFDNALIKGEDVPLFVESLRRFEKEFPNERHVSHLAELADTLSAIHLEAGPKLVAIGHQHTSVSQEQWTVQNHDTGEDEPYNMLKGIKHRFIKVLSDDTPKVPNDAPNVEDLSAENGPAVPTA